MKTDDNEDIFDLMPFFALAHHIYKNKLDYVMKNPNNIGMIHESKYLMQIYKNKNLSQDDLASLFGQSKGTIAKHLRTLEDEGYIIREVDDTNRRKYILNTTEKGDRLAVLKINELNEWNDKVGVSELDEETIQKIRNIARKSGEILKDL
ncbi:MAG: MarR family transcriptional regulator [Methanobrevibacter sp.]|nr:MarR family transcriptional regulator [Methanobrevibacter sp.]